MSDSIRLSSVTLNAPDAAALAAFSADITGGTVTFAKEDWAIVKGPPGLRRPRRAPVLPDDLG